MRSWRILMTVVMLAGMVSLSAQPGFTQAEPKTTLVAEMTAEEEVPQKGPEGAKGRAVMDIDPASNQLCYNMTTEGLNEPVIAGHIHQGPKGVAGPVFIDLDVATHGLEGCVVSEAEKLEAVMADPPSYYVNLHTPSYRDGAIRGQLRHVVRGEPAAPRHSY